MYLIFLDWSRTFDKIKLDALLRRLERFGLPSHIINIIHSIYSCRNFDVRYGGTSSDERRQYSGIAQGCPLSPYLFILVMSVLFQDVEADMYARGIQINNEAFLVSKEILYADDTVIIGNNSQQIQEYLMAIVTCGKYYGLDLNWNKTQVMNINDEADFYDEDGNALKQVGQIIYLGASIRKDDNHSAEISRRLGQSYQSFLKLKSV